MSRAAIERALAAARNAKDTQRPEQCIIIQHHPKPLRDEWAQDIYEQNLAELRAQVRHTRGRI